MEEPDRAGRLAAYLHDGHRGGRDYVGLPDALRPGSLAEAYAAQDRLNLLFAADRGPIGGHKIALTSTVMQKMTGIGHPVAGCVFASMVRESGATIRLAEYRHLGFECEMAIEIGRDLSPGDAPFDRDRVAGAVAAVRPAFELVDDRNADYATLDALGLVADNTWNGGIVLGPRIADWRDRGIGARPARLLVDGGVVGEGNSRDALGHPLDALAWLAGSLAERGKTLAAGMVVMTGSVIATRFPKPGERARFELDGLGAVEAAFV